MLRRNTEDMMFKKLRLKLPSEQLVVAKSISSLNFWELPGFIVHHDGDKSHLIITHREKLNYLMKFLFEAFFPHTNDFLISKVLFTGIIIDTRKYYKLDMSLYQEIALARDISLIQNDDEMIPEYDFFFSKNKDLIEKAKSSFVLMTEKLEEDSCYLQEETNELDFEYLEKLQKDPTYLKKIRASMNTKMLPEITNKNYDHIKREYVEKKLFKKYRLKLVREKFIVHTGVKTKRILNYPGFTLTHLAKKTLINITDKEKLNYLLKFLYEMFCPRENPIVMDIQLYKELTVNDVSFRTIAEDDFERIFPFIKTAFTVVLIHNEKFNVLHYLFTFVNDKTAQSNDDHHIKKEHLEENNYALDDLEKLDQEFEKAVLYDKELYKHEDIWENKKRKRDVLPKILTSSRFKLEQLNATLLELEEADSEEESTDEEWEDCDDDEKEIKKKEKKLYKQKLKYAQKVEALAVKQVREKGPAVEPDPDEMQFINAPVERLYRLRVAPEFQGYIRQNMLPDDKSFPAYGNFEELGFKLIHYKTYTTVQIDKKRTNRDHLLKFLCGIFILRDLPETHYERPPYKAIVLDGLHYVQFTENFVRAAVDAEFIELIWDPNKYAPDYHI